MNLNMIFLISHMFQIYVLTWESGIEEVMHVRIFKEGHIHYVWLKLIQLLISLEKQ